MPEINEWRSSGTLERAHPGFGVEVLPPNALDGLGAKFVTIGRYRRVNAMRDET
jgi:hypothetical protein